MRQATNSAYMGKGKQQMKKQQAARPQQGGGAREQMKQQIKVVAQKLMQERDMPKDEAVQAATQLVKEQMAEGGNGQESMNEYNMGGTIGSAVGAVAGSVIPGAGTAIGSTVGGAAGSLIGKAVSGSDNPKQYTGRQKSDHDTLMNKSKGKDSVFYKMGGSINKAPGMKSQYEAEGGEVVEGEAPKVTGEQGNMKEQTDDTYVIKGPSHKNGGVKGKGGERVFSDSIKIPGTSKTYADAAKSIGSKTGEKSMEKKLEANPYDQILKHSLKRTSQRNEAQKDRLFELQEKQKDAEGIGNGDPDRATKKFGGDLGATSDNDVVNENKLASKGDFGNDYDPALNDNLIFDEDTGQYLNKDILEGIKGQQKAQREHMQELAAQHGMTLREFLREYPDKETYQEKKTIERNKDRSDAGTKMKHGGALPEYYDGGSLPSQGPDKQFGYNVSGSGQGLTLDEKLENMNTMMGDTTSNNSSSSGKVPTKTPKIPKIDNTPDPIDKRTDQDLMNTLPEPEYAYSGSATGAEDEMSPARKNIYEEMMKQQEKAGKLTSVSRAAQTAPAIYNLMDSNDTNYQKPQKNRMADDAISEIENMPTNYNIQPQLNQISDSYDKITDQMNTYSASPQTARANMRQAFAKKLGAESQAYGKKENMENQMERQQAKALAQQKYQTGTQAANFRKQANMLNLKTQAAADQQEKTGISQLSNLAANISAEEQKKLSELQRRNLNYELLGNSGVASRMASDASAIKYMMKNNPEYVKKYMPYVYKNRMKKNKKGDQKED